MGARLNAPLLAGTALLAALAGAGGTFALWHGEAAVDSGQLTLGGLDVELAGAATWEETSPDVTAVPVPIADPAAFRARPGDAVSLRQDFRAEVEGDTLAATISVDWTGTAPALPAGVTARYTVLDDTGTALFDPVALGETASFDFDADTDGDGRGELRDETFTFKVDMAFAGSMADRVGETSPVQSADLGAVQITLDQVRRG